MSISEYIYPLYQSAIYSWKPLVRSSHSGPASPSLQAQMNLATAQRSATVEGRIAHKAAPEEGQAMSPAADFERALRRPQCSGFVA